MKKIFIIAAAALALAACDKNDDTQVSAPEAATVTATIGESTVTRVSESQWEAGDKIGISSTVGAVGGPYVNVGYTTDNGNGNFKGTPLFFYKPMTLTAYYPFAGTEGTVPGTDGIITATTDARAQKNLAAIDFLWDQQSGFTADNRDVNFTFSHKMSKVTFTFIKSDPVYKDNVQISEGVDVGNMVAYQIEKLILDGTFDTATGICAAGNTKGDLKIEFNKGTAVSEKPMPSLIVFPQTLPEGSLTLRVFTDEIAGIDQHKYKCSISFSNGEIKPGCHYNYSIQVTKYGLIVGNMSIEEWAKGTDRFQTATIDGEQPGFQTKGNN